jgi:hypothetical protein
MACPRQKPGQQLCIWTFSEIVTRSDLGVTRFGLRVTLVGVSVTLSDLA